jgi:GTP cyclohydrolase I
MAALISLAQVEFATATPEIASYLYSMLKPFGVAVLVEAAANFSPVS